MSFQSVSDQLAILQESNAQLKDLIDRLANLKFQPGSVPLDDEEGNVEDFENLQEDVYDLPDDGLGSESGEQKMDLDATVKRAIKELNLYVSARLYNMGII